MTVRPAFRSQAHAIAYAAFAGFCLALPVLLAAVGRPTRSDVYRSLRAESGAYAFIERETLDERSDIDMVFVGPSHIYAGINTVLVQNALSSKLGRPAVARTLGVNFAGLDVTYAVLVDLLKHRHVRTAVLEMPRMEDNRDEPHALAYRVMDFRDHGELLRYLSLRHRAQLYGDFVLGAPRHLLSFLRANPRDVVVPEAETLGAVDVPKNMDGSPFVSMIGPRVDLGAEGMIYSTSSASRFQYANRPLSRYQNFFAERIVALLAQYGVKGVAVHMPMWSERRSTLVEELMPWPDTFGLPLVGVAGATLFAGLTDEDTAKFFKDVRHLNRNGAAHFTRAVLPALLELHGTS